MWLIKLPFRIIALPIMAIVAVFSIFYSLALNISAMVAVKRKMKVLKFGGTSVGSAQRMKEVAKLITDGEQKIVVLLSLIHILWSYLKEKFSGIVAMDREFSYNRNL